MHSIIFIFWTTTLLFATTVHADKAPQAESPLETAIYKVLKHGSLADTKHLSKAMNLQVLIPTSERNEKNISAIIKSKPDYILASGLSYNIKNNQDLKTIDINLSLLPVSCQSLPHIRLPRKKPTPPQLLTDGAGSVETIKWGNEKGIALSIYDYSWGNCEIRLTQSNIPASHLKTTFIQPKENPEPFLRKMADINSLDDLRAYKKISNTLKTEFLFKKNETKEDFFFNGAARVMDIVPFAYEISYSGNDSGWSDYPFWLPTPKIPADRVVTLKIPVDIRQLCINEQNILQGELFKDIEFRKTLSNTLESVKTVNNVKITTTIQSAKNCISGFSFSQETDFENKISNALIFDTSDVTNGKIDLNNKALSKIQTIKNYIKEAGLVKIEIQKNSALEGREDVDRLAEALKSTMIANGLESMFITIPNGYKGGRWIESPALPSIYVEISAN